MDLGTLRWLERSCLPRPVYQRLVYRRGQTLLSLERAAKHSAVDNLANVYLLVHRRSSRALAMVLTTTTTNSSSMWNVFFFCVLQRWVNSKSVES